jgi:hypothetical protein
MSEESNNKTIFLSPELKEILTLQVKHLGGIESSEWGNLKATFDDLNECTFCF